MSNVKYVYSDIDYDEHINKNQHCKDENAALCEVLNRYIKNGDSVLDIGAGTGFVGKNVDRAIAYSGVDYDLAFCEEYGWVHSEGHRFLRRIDKDSFDVITAFFSVDYMNNPIALLEIIKKMKRNAIIVLQDKPYKEGSDSVYAGRKWFFLKKHFVRQKIRNVFIWILKKTGNVVEDFNLLGEPYYRVLIMKRKGA